jgi:hypothetical protein
MTNLIILGNSCNTYPPRKEHAIVKDLVVQSFRAEFGFTLVLVVHVPLLQHELAIEDIMQHYHWQVCTRGESRI